MNFFPSQSGQKMVREVLNENQMQLMTNPPCGGILFLREAIATYLKEFRGMTVLPSRSLSEPVLNTSTDS